AVGARAVGQNNRRQIARALVDTIAAARDRDLLADLEHLGRPSRAAEHGCGAHLAAIRMLRAAGSDDVEVDPAVRIDEVDTRDRAGELDVLVAIPRAAAVVCRERHRHEHADRECYGSLHGGEYSAG